MRTPRLFLEQELKPGAQLLLPQDKAHHVSHVLRMRQGGSISLFNNSAYEYDAVLTELTKKHVRVEITDRREVDKESPLKITLALGLSRGQRMDYSIQKAVELGVYQIVPLLTEFSNVKLQDERITNKLSHWYSIIISATEQCGRNRLTKIARPVLFGEYLAESMITTRLLLHPGSENAFSKMQKPPEQLELLVGPEGGFSQNEYELACQSGCLPISLGPRILRAETAVVTGLSVVQNQWGDL